MTRGVLELLPKTQHAFSLITKSCLVESDLALIEPMARQSLAAVDLSITTLERALARAMDLRTASAGRARA